MNVAVYSAGSNDQVLARHHFSGRADDQFRIHALHRVRIAGLADFHDAATLDSDIAFHDPPVIDDQGVRDDEIERSWEVLSPGVAALAHPVANDFAATKSDLVAVGRKVLFDLDD